MWTCDCTHCVCVPLALQKVPEFPVWTTCQKHVEYIKFPINFPIMESKKKKIVLKQFLDLEYPLLETLHNCIFPKICKIFLMFSKLGNIKFPTIGIPNSRIV